MAIPGVGKGKYNNMTVGTTATKVPFSQNPRELFALCNLGSSTVYVGFDDQVTISNGFPIFSGGGSFSVDGNVTVWLISDTAGQDVRWIEAG